MLSQLIILVSSNYGVYKPHPDEAVEQAVTAGKIMHDSSVFLRAQAPKMTSGREDVVDVMILSKRVSID